MTDKLHLDILPEEQLRLFETLSSETFIRDFYLAGGTCLAMQIGHRQSIDFDFFIPDDFNTSGIVNILTQLGISFFAYRYNIIGDFKTHRNIRLAGLKDLAAMKLEAIAGRGSKKDFIDLFFLLQRYTLQEIFSFHTQKYGTGLGNQYHHLKSLIYFEDAETEAMPVMIKPLEWDNVKTRIISLAKGFQLK